MKNTLLNTIGEQVENITQHLDNFEFYKSNIDQTSDPEVIASLTSYFISLLGSGLGDMDLSQDDLLLRMRYANNKLIQLLQPKGSKEFLYSSQHSIEQKIRFLNQQNLKDVEIQTLLLGLEGHYEGLMNQKDSINPAKDRTKWNEHANKIRHYQDLISAIKTDCCVEDGRVLVGGILDEKGDTKETSPRRRRHRRGGGKRTVSMRGAGGFAR